MEKNQIALFNRVQTFISSQQNNFLKREFFRNIGQETSIIEIDKNKGIVVCQDGSKFLFSKSLNRNVKSFYSQLKKEIDLVFIEINPTSKTKKYIEKTFDYIIDSQKDLLITFPLYNELIEEIKNYLNGKYNLDIVLSRERDYNSSYFKVKHEYGKKVFSEIHTIAIDCDIIDDNLVSEIEFVDVFTQDETTSAIQFKVETSLVVSFLEVLRPFFNNYNAKTIEDSKRFLTKRKNILTQSNYNRNKKTLKAVDFPTLSEIKSKVEKLIL